MTRKRSNTIEIIFIEMTILRRTVKGVIFDLDGVLENSQGLEDGACELVQRLERAGLPIVILTNDIRPECYSRADELSKLGLRFRRDQWVTPYDAIQLAIGSRGCNRPLFVGERAPQEFEWLNRHSADSDCMILGDVRNMQPKSKRYNTVTSKGGPLFALQNNKILLADNLFVPDVGFFIERWERALAQTAEVIGKPGPFPYLIALERLRFRANEIMMVSDSFVVDLTGAAEVGVQGCHFTKYAHPRDIEASDGRCIRIASLLELLRLLNL